MEQRTVGLRQLGNKAWPPQTASFGIVAGAIILTFYLGFSRGDWVVGGATRQMDE